MIHALVLCLSLVSGDLESRRSPVVRVVERASPSVVFIGTVQVIDQRRRSVFDPFAHPNAPRTAEGLGSGVIVDPQGLIVTNEHVIRGASAIHVVLADGRKLDAEVIGSDADNDLAVLKVATKEPLPAAPLGTSADLMIGETVIAIGSPLGLKKTVTVGVLSAQGRSIRNDDRVYNDFLQTDASINPGNSGGPLLNIDGEIVGINSAIIASAQNIGFAIPADKVRRIVNELLQYGKVRPAWVGLDVAPLTADVARRLKWDRTYGALVAGVEPSSPAEKAGLMPGDVIARVGNTQVEDAFDLHSRVRGFTARSPVAVQYVRAGQPAQTTLLPTEFPEELVDAAVWGRLGLKVKHVARAGMVITSLRNGSAAAQVGLAPGDVVLRINNQPTATEEAFREAVIHARGGRSVLLLVRRGSRGYHLTLPF